MEKRKKINKNNIQLQYVMRCEFQQSIRCKIKLKKIYIKYIIKISKKKNILTDLLLKFVNLELN